MKKKPSQGIIFLLFGVLLLFAVLIGAFVIWQMNNVTPIDAVSYGPNCRIDRGCDNLIGIDCGSAADGPYYYVDKNTKQIVERCGGYCMTGQCTNCPPREWTCN